MTQSPRSSRGWRWLVRVYVLGLHVLVVVLLISPSLVQRCKRYITHDPAVMDEYKGMVRAHEVVSAGLPEGAIVFLGDSRMRDLPVREVAAGPAINFSIGGDTTKGLLDRVPRYSRLETARLIVVGIGINDLSHFNDDVMLDHYGNLLRYLTTLGTKVTITALLPIAEGTYRQANATLLSGQKVTNTRICAVNRALRELCASHTNIQFIDVNGVLAEPDGNLRGDYTDDGLHLNPTGASVWAKALREHLVPR